MAQLPTGAHHLSIMALAEATSQHERYAQRTAYHVLFLHGARDRLIDQRLHELQHCRPVLAHGDLRIAHDRLLAPSALLPVYWCMQSLIVDRPVLYATLAI